MEPPALRKPMVGAGGLSLSGPQGSGLRGGRSEGEFGTEGEDKEIC